MRFAFPILLAVTLLIALTSVSLAGTTAIDDTSNPTAEFDLWEILQDIARDESGESGLTLRSGWDYDSKLVFEDSNKDSVIEFFRVQDSGGSSPLVIQQSYGGVNDQVWQDGTTKITAEAKFAGHDHEFGWIDNTVPGGLEHTIWTSTETAVGGTPTAADYFSTNFEWYLTDLNSGDTWLSENGTGDDHMVTFEMRNAGANSFNGDRTWIAAWEDLDPCHWDADYNDFVAKFSATAIPLPSAAWVGLATLLGLAGLRRIRRRRSSC